MMALKKVLRSRSKKQCSRFVQLNFGIMGVRPASVPCSITVLVREAKAFLFELNNLTITTYLEYIFSGYDLGSNSSRKTPANIF